MARFPLTLIATILSVTLGATSCGRKEAGKSRSRRSSASPGLKSGQLVADQLGAAAGAKKLDPDNGGTPPFRVLGAAILTIGEKYVAPTRVDPSRMFDKALEYVEAERPEIRIIGSARKRRVTVQVGERSRQFTVDSISSISLLYTQLKEILGYVRSQLASRKDINKKDLRELEYAAVNGLVSTLDPHSVLMPPKIYTEMQIRTRGAFGGIGIVISIRDGRLTVISPIDGTPAAREGIRAGDHIVKIEDESTISLPLGEAVSRLRGPPGSPVTFWVERDGWTEPRRFTIIRERIEIKSVSSRMLPGYIGYVRINRFSHNTTEELKEHLLRLKQKNVRGIILDLWNNPGGLLQQAEKVADAFLSTGDIVITEAARGVVLRVRKASSDTTLSSYPMVVLVNRGSASAAEIVAGALKNQGRALVIGERTFGKGTVQMLFENEDGSALKLTVAQYLTPGSVSIQAVGVVPDLMTNPIVLRKEWLRMFAHEADARRRAKRKDLLPARSQSEQRPAAQLHYLNPEQVKGAQTKGRSSGSENAADPPVIELARLLLTRYPGQRMKMVRASQRFLREWKHSQDQNIIRALRTRQVDWSAPPSEAPSASATRLGVFVTPTAAKPIQAGAKVEIKVSVTNRSPHTIYRLHGRTEAPSYFLDEREFIFGRIAPGATKSARVTVRIPSHTLTSIQPLRIILASPNLAGQTRTHSRISVTALPQPQFHMSYRLHDDLKGNGNGRPESGETIRLRVTVTNVGTGAAENSVVALRNLAGKGLFLINGRQTIKQLPAGATRKVDLSFRIEPTFNKSTMKLELSVFAENVRVLLQEHLKIPFNPAKASAAGLVGAITPPRITVNKVPLSVGQKTESVDISGVATDQNEVRDVFIEVSNFDAEQVRHKAYYAATRPGADRRRLPFKTRVPLWPGLNSILIVARENSEVMGFHRLIVHKPKP